MSTVLKDFQELALYIGLKPVRSGPSNPPKRGAPARGASPPRSGNGRRSAVGGNFSRGPVFGEIYWISNKAMNFGDCQNGGKHPGVVIRTGTSTATVCPMTSQINNRQGFVYHPERGMRLSGPGTVLTVKSVWRHVSLAELTDWAGWMSPE